MSTWVCDSPVETSAKELEPTTDLRTLYDELKAVAPGGKLPQYDGMIPFDEIWLENEEDLGLGEDEGMGQDHDEGYEGDVEHCGHCRESSEFT